MVSCYIGCLSFQLPFVSAGANPTQFNHNGGHRWVSNPRPPDCQSGVLPTELLAHNISQTFSLVSYHKTNFRSTTTCKSDSLFARGEVVDPPSSVNALINTLRFFVELADGILWLQFTGGVMTPQWLSVIFLWFDLFNLRRCPAFLCRFFNAR